MNFYDCYMMTGSATHRLLVECINPGHIQVQADMVTNLTMIVTKDVMEAGMMIGIAETGTHMVGKGNGATEMMINMEEMGIHIVVMVIVTGKNMRIAMAEMVTGTMIIGEEVKALMGTNMAKEVEARIETESALLMMTANILLGMCLLV